MSVHKQTQNIINRLSRIEGHTRGIKKMVEELVQGSVITQYQQEQVEFQKEQVDIQKQMRDLLKMQSDKEENLEDAPEKSEK